MATLQDILIDSSSYLDLQAEVPDSSEIDVRVRFANMAVQEWGNAYKFRQLKTELTFSGLFASLAVSNYRFLDGPPVEYAGQGSYYEYREIQPADRFSKGSDDKYCYVTGNNSAGIALHVNGIAANATLTINYIRGASGMATLTDMCEVPDYQFVTDRVISYVLQARNDERFPIVLGDGNRRLRNMVSVEMIRLPGGVNSSPRSGVAAYSIGS